MKGSLKHPWLRWSYSIGGSENECFPVGARDGKEDLLFAYGGCVVRFDGEGKIQWKSPAFGLNAIAAVEDLDGDGRPEIVASTGYEILVFSADDGELLFRNYVGFPASAGTPANTILCHRFDPESLGMHLVVPMMSSKEVRIFDFRNGQRNGILTHTLWMDDAYHPTVAAGDVDNDGKDELIVSKLCGVYVFDVLTGEMKQSVRWTSNGERHRNYGLLQLTDVDQDSVPEVVIVADRVARHMAVLDCDAHGSLTLLWDRFVEFIYPSDTTELRYTAHSVCDVDGDGKPEIVVSLFNTRKDERWWLEILDPLTGVLKYDYPDRYLWGVQDIDGDGTGEILVGIEHTRQPTAFSTIEILKMRGAAAEPIWRMEHAHFAGRSLRPSAGNSNFRPVQFGHDETWYDHVNGERAVYLFTRGSDRTQTLLEVRWKGDAVSGTLSSPLGSTGQCVLAARADIDGDGRRECIVSESNGRVMAVIPGEPIKSTWTIGMRLQLEGFSAARPGLVPVVYRADPAGATCVTIPDNTNTLHQLQADRSTGEPSVMWKTRGRGWIGYDNSFHSAYICDVDADGEQEIMAVHPERYQCSELMAFASDGRVKRSWVLDGVPAPAPTRIGLYEWSVAGNGGNQSIIASFYSSYSMNSEQTISVDLYNNRRWHRREYGEGEWGRGMGPWGAHAVTGIQRGAQQVVFLAKDLFCHLDAETGEWVRDPWLLWHATNSVMNQPEWDFTEDRKADFGSGKDPFTAYGSPILIDIDGDGVEEILVGGCFGGFGMLRHDHTVLWWVRTPFTDVMLRLPGIADVLGDGRLCVGICHADGVFVCLEGTTGRELWNLDLRATTSDIVSCDIDGDGKEEFITGTADGRLLAIGTDGEGNGTVRWELDLGYSLGSPVIADADGDGMPEVLVVSGDGTLICIGKEE